MSRNRSDSVSHVTRKQGRGYPQQSSDQQAAESLARLRLGSSIGDKYRRILSASSQVLLSGWSSSAPYRPPDREQHNAGVCLLFKEVESAGMDEQHD